MDTTARLRRIILPVLVTMAFTGSQGTEQPTTAPKAQTVNGVVIRGCLKGSKLSHIDPADPALPLPDALRVTSIRVIRSQVRELSGHQVELIGTLRGLPDQENGLLVAQSDKGKLYLGGGDKNLGQDLVTERIEPPTIHARMIKDLAPTCTATQSK